MDEATEFVCESCDFTFQVIWKMDYERSRLKEGTSIICYCPHCGCGCLEEVESA